MTAMSARWHLRLLGRFELSDGTTTLHRLPSRAVLLILARLALAPQRDHPREELIDLLWPAVDLAVGRNRLRQALSSLRSVLEPGGEAGMAMLMADRHTVRLAPGAVASDVDALRAALRAGHASAAAALHHGELLPGHFDEWVLEERREVEEAVARAGAAAAPNARPDDQAPRAAHAASAASAARAPPPLALAAMHWLPAYVTRMLGYEEAGAGLASAVQAHRLVLLRGPGGAGKTRLAVEVARWLAHRATGLAGAAEEKLPFDAVVFVPLASVTTAAALCEAVIRALRSEGASGTAGAGTAAPLNATAQVEHALAGRSVLLVLDNFEQLVDVGQSTLSQWLTRLPTLHLLVTSRRALGLDGEHEQALEALALPPPGASLQDHARNPAVALFADRARAARGSFSLNERNHARVAAIVQLLHGLPLAIELAAARVRSIALPQMQFMLEAALSGQPDAAFALLMRSGPRAADDPRHASMLHVMQWSFQHLSPAARGVLDVLSVFAGGATLDAVAAMSGLALHEAAMHLDELVASSVVTTCQHLQQGGDDVTRYQPFEPVREFALMGLDAGAVAALRSGHWRWVQSWCAGLGRAPSLAEFRDEQANLIAAWDFAAGHDRPAAVLASALHCLRALDDVTLPPSALALLRRCLAATTQDDELRARVHALLAEQCFESGQSDTACEHAEQARRQMPPASRFCADALYVAARIRLRVHNDTTTTGALIDEGLALAVQHQRIDTQARLLTLRGICIARRARDYAGKIELDTQALALWRAFGAPARVTEGLVNLALALGFVHRVPEQLALLAQAQTTAAAQGQVRLQAFVLSVTGYALADLCRWEESAASYRACLHVAWSHSAWREWFYALWNLPRTLAHQRQPERAAPLLAFADRFAAERFGQLGWSDLRERRRTRRLVRAQIGAEREAALWSQGRELTMAQAMRMALDLG